MFETKEYINKTVTVLENNREYIVNEYLKYYYIELPKFRKENVNYEDITSQWLTFIDSENSNEIEKIMEKNNTIKKAKEELEYLEGDKAFKRRVELREKYERDMSSARYHGIEIGENNKKMEIAKKMLKEKLDVSLICKITGLNEQEIEKLKVL